MRTVYIFLVLGLANCSPLDGEQNIETENPEKNRFKLALPDKLLANTKKLFNTPKKDIVGMIQKRRCDVCMESLRCKTLSKCDHCTKFCKSDEAPQTEPPIVGSIQLYQKDEAIIPTEPTLKKANFENPRRYYTIDTVGPGSKFVLLTKLFNIAQKDNVEKFVILAKPKNKYGDSTMDRPLIIDTAKVFDGKDVSIHLPKENTVFNSRFVSKLDKELSRILEEKRNLGKMFLTDNEIDSIIEQLLRSETQNRKQIPHDVQLGSRMLDTDPELITTKRSIPVWQSDGPSHVTVKRAPNPYLPLARTLQDEPTINEAQARSSDDSEDSSSSDESEEYGPAYPQQGYIYRTPENQVIPVHPMNRGYFGQTVPNKQKVFNNESPRRQSLLEDRQHQKSAATAPDNITNRFNLKNSDELDQDEVGVREDENLSNDEEEAIVTLTQPPYTTSNEQNLSDPVVGKSLLDSLEEKGEKWLKDKLDFNSKTTDNKLKGRVADQKTDNLQSADSKPNYVNADQFSHLLKNLEEKIENIGDIVQKTCGKKESEEEVGNEESKKSESNPMIVSASQSNTEASLDDNEPQIVYKQTTDQDTDMSLTDATPTDRRESDILGLHEDSKTTLDTVRGDNQNNKPTGKRLLNSQEEITACSKEEPEEYVAKANTVRTQTEPTVACSKEESEEYVANNLKPSLDGRSNFKTETETPKPLNSQEKKARSKEESEDVAARRSMEHSNQPKDNEEVSCSKEESEEFVAERKKETVTTGYASEDEAFKPKIQTVTNEEEPITSKIETIASQFDPEEEAIKQREDTTAKEDVGCSKEDEEDEVYINKAPYRSAEDPEDTKQDASSRLQPFNKFKKPKTIKKIHDNIEDGFQDKPLKKLLLPIKKKIQDDKPIRHVSEKNPEKTAKAVAPPTRTFQIPQDDFPNEDLNKKRMGVSESQILEPEDRDRLFPAHKKHNKFRNHLKSDEMIGDPKSAEQLENLHTISEQINNTPGSVRMDQQNDDDTDRKSDIELSDDNGDVLGETQGMPSLYQRFGEDLPKEVMPENKHNELIGANEEKLPSSSQELTNSQENPFVFGKVLPQINNSKESFQDVPNNKITFVGTGMQLPLNMKKHKDGSYQLSVDVDKLCNTCTENGKKCNKSENDQVGQAQQQVNELRLSNAPQDQEVQNRLVITTPYIIGKPTEAKTQQPLDKTTVNIISMDIPNIRNKRKHSNIQNLYRKSKRRTMSNHNPEIDGLNESASSKKINNSKVDIENTRKTASHANIDKESPQKKLHKFKSPLVESDLDKKHAIAKRTPKFENRLPFSNDIPISGKQQNQTRFNIIDESLKKINDSMRTFFQRKKKLENYYNEKSKNSKKAEESNITEKKLSILNNVLKWMKDVAIQQKT